MSRMQAAGLTARMRPQALGSVMTRASVSLVKTVAFSSCCALACGPYSNITAQPIAWESRIVRYHDTSVKLRSVAQGFVAGVV